MRGSGPGRPRRPIDDTPSGARGRSSWHGATVSSAPFRIHRPARALAVLVDALVAVALGGLAWWCWHRGVIVIVQDGTPIDRIDGMWWAAAAGVATVAGVALLDALRQGVLAASRPGRRNLSR